MPKHFSPQDAYFHKAKEKGYRARSAFKLEEILQKFPRLLKKNSYSKVIDFGACPGSFLQILGNHMESGKIAGVDLQPIKKFPKNFSSELKLIQGDIFEEETADKIFDFFKGQKAHLITSDVAPKTSGIKSVDQWKSIELNQRVMELCEKFLQPHGHLVAKIFKGEDFEEFWVEDFRKMFKTAKTFKPRSCRDRSVEFFLIGMGYLGGNKNPENSESTDNELGEKNNKQEKFS